MSYIGRFAPTPSGPLHFGSLVTALASYLEAKANNGKWHIRIDDLDPPRIAKGAISTILSQLEAHGSEWDGPVVYQSNNNDAYQSAYECLDQLSLIYACECSRKTIAQLAQPSENGPIYPGLCRDKGLSLTSHAVRINVGKATVFFDDAICGTQTLDMAHNCGDFVIRRADGLWAYQIAAVVDDAALSVSHIVRGQDLLDSSLRQSYLRLALNLPQPQHKHIPLVYADNGQKLSKQNKAPAVKNENATENVLRALQALGLPVDRDLKIDNTAEALAWAISHY